LSTVDSNDSPDLVKRGAMDDIPAAADLDYRRERRKSHTLYTVAMADWYLPVRLLLRRHYP